MVESARIRPSERLRFDPFATPRFGDRAFEGVLFAGLVKVEQITNGVATVSDQTTGVTPKGALPLPLVLTQLLESVSHR